jgi:hypothetical protein
LASDGDTLVIPAFFFFPAIRFFQALNAGVVLEKAFWLWGGTVLVPLAAGLCLRITESRRAHFFLQALPLVETLNARTALQVALGRRSGTIGLAGAAGEAVKRNAGLAGCAVFLPQALDALAQGGLATPAVAIGIRGAGGGFFTFPPGAEHAPPATGVRAAREIPALAVEALFVRAGAILIQNALVFGRIGRAAAAEQEHPPQKKKATSQDFLHERFPLDRSVAPKSDGCILH